MFLGLRASTVQAYVILNRLLWLALKNWLLVERIAPWRKMPKVLKRTYLDPIHQDIVLDRAKPEERLIIDLIDTREFQRMRRIHQLGVSFFTFHGAEGSRFTHSLGVMHVASRLADILSQKTPSVANHRALIMASALLHDLGSWPVQPCDGKNPGLPSRRLVLRDHCRQNRSQPDPQCILQRRRVAGS